MRVLFFTAWTAAAIAIGAAGYSCGYNHGIKDEGARAEREMNQLAAGLDMLSKWLESWHEIHDCIDFYKQVRPQIEQGGAESRQTPKSAPYARPNTKDAQSTPKQTRRAHGVLARRK